MKSWVIVMVSAALLAWTPAHVYAELPRIRAEGTRYVDDAGRPAILRGCNLGNWLVLEMWMAHWDGAQDQWDAERILAERFGTEQKDRWLEQYREAFIQERDFELIKSFGFNCVRIPFHYANVLEAEPPYALRADAYRWLDRALELCEKHGIYAILDLHAAPGAQSIDHNAGRSRHNRLWSDEACQDAMVRLWSAVAHRYAGRSTVAAYDILNEPYGDYRGNLGQPMLALARRTYSAIRQHDGDTIIFLPAVIGTGLRMYDIDEVRGWNQVALTQYNYPGLFGSSGGLKNMMAFLHRGLAEDQALVERLNRPMLIGEFNGAVHANGGVYLTRMQYDEYAKYGWAATMWSHKILKPSAGAGIDGWYAVTNAQPMSRINVKTSTREEIDRHIAEIATVPLVPHERLQKLLTSSEPIDLPVEIPPEPPTSAPGDGPLPPWTKTKIGGADGTALPMDNATVVYAKGSDIFGTSDSFTYLSQPAGSSVTIEATVAGLFESDQYAKAGAMIRFGSAPGAPFAFMHAFPDGTLAFCWRPAAGERAQERKFHVGELPARVRLTRQGDTVRAFYYFDDGWTPAGEITFADGPADCLAGLAVTSHSGRYFTRADFRDTFVAKEERK